MQKIENSKKRSIEVLVLSDIHLGTYGCHGKELLKYLRSVKPKTVVLNGDIIDIWQFSKRYWPKSHMRVVHEIIKWVTKGVKVYYITGNHDEMLRKFAGFQMGSLLIDNKIVLELDGQKAWFFHGDIFDVTMKHSKWLTKLGSHGYDLLILINASCNWLSEKMGKGKMSISKSIKNGVKKAVKFINDFEQVTADIAIMNGYDYVLCGHIHHPEIKMIKNDSGQVMYLNSGDWIENLTALEYNSGKWSLYQYNEKEFELENDDADSDDIVMKSNHEIFNQLLNDFKKLSSTY